MSVGAHGRPGTAWIMLSFLFGSLFHWALLQGYFAISYKQGSASEFTNHRLTNTGFALIGGFTAVFYLLPTIIRNLQRQEERRWKVIGLTGLIGVLAVWIALLIMFLGISLVVAIQGSGWLAPLVFFFTFVGTATYGMRPVILSIPFGFLYGVVWGLVVWQMRSFRSQHAPPEGTRRDSSAKALWVGIVGLIAFPVPIVGTVLSVLAVAWALGARRQAKLRGKVWPKAARAACFLGLIGCLLKVLIYVPFAL